MSKWRKRIRGSERQIGRPFKLGRRSMFYEPPKYEYLSKIISLENPEKAHGSVKELWEEFDKAKTDTKKLTIARATMLAANRALAMQKRANLSDRERAEFREVYWVYRNAADHMYSKKIKLSVGKSGMGSLYTRPQIKELDNEITKAAAHGDTKEWQKTYDKYARQIVYVEMPSGELMNSKIAGYIWGAEMKGLIEKGLPIVKQDKFAAQGLEGKVRIKTDLLTAVDMTRYVDPYRIQLRKA